MSAGDTPVLLLVAGAPGAGKTTFSRALAAKLGWPLFGKDDIKERLFDTVGFRSRAEKVALGTAAMAVLCYAADAALAAGPGVILESNFESRDMPALTELIRAHGAGVITLRLEAPMSVLYLRFLAREASPDRHTGHKVNDTFPPVAATSAEGQKRTPAPPPSQAAFEAGVRSRGMLSFQMGSLIRLSTGEGWALSVDRIADELYLLMSETRPGAT